jgi:hypothetical protein
MVAALRDELRATVAAAEVRRAAAARAEAVVAAELRAALAAAEARAGTAEARAGMAEARAGTAEAVLAAMRASRSWRVGAPLRRAAETARGLARRVQPNSRPITRAV